MRFYTKWKSAMIVAVSLGGFAAFAAVTRAALEDETTTTTTTDEGTTQDEQTSTGDETTATESEGAEFAVISTLDFENEETYTKGWTIGSKTTAYYGTRTVGDTTSHFMNLKNTGSGNDANTYTIANKMFLEAEKWSMDFDFAGYNSNSKTVYLEVQQTEGTLLKFQFAASWTAPVTVTDGAGNELGTINCDLQDKNTRGNEIAVTVWHHLSLIDEGEGVYATVTAADGTEEIAKVKIAESGVHPTGLNLQQGNALSQWAIDDLTLAIAKAWTNAVTLDFENEETYTKGWTIGSKTTAYYGTRTVGDTTSHFMNLKNTGSGNDANTYTIANKMFLEAEKWTLDFDFAGYNSNSKTVYLEVQQAEGTLLKFQFAAAWTAPVTVTDGAGNELGTINCDLQDKNTRGNEIAVTVWHHLSLIDEGEGVYATVTAADGTEEIAKVKIAESGVHPTGLNLQQGNALSQWAIDDLVLKFFGAGEVVEVPSIKAAGETYETNTITITGDENTTIYYTLTENGVTSDAIVYEAPFTVSTSVTITAWAVSANDNDSETETLDVVAGKIVTPTATISSVAGTSREVTLATTTPDATITYFVNGAEGVAYEAPFTISDTAVVAAIATRGEFVSDTLTTTLAAGTEVQLAGVTYSVATVADSALAVEYTEKNLKDIIVNADQTSVLCEPAVEGIEYTYIPYVNGKFDESQAVKATVAAGDTLKALAIGKLTAVAKNANYVTSEETELYLKLPSELVAERVYDFSRAAWPAITTDKYPATLGSTVETTINNTNYSTIAIGDSLVSGFLVQSGTDWIKRTICDGLLLMNSGARNIAVQDLEQGNIVKFYGRSNTTDVNYPFKLTLVDNGVGALDAAETTEGSVFTFDIVKGGTLALSLGRYGYIDSIIVYSDPNAPKTPSINLESVNGASRFVSLAASPEGVVIYYALGSVGADSTVVWGDDVVYNGGNIEVVTTETPYIRAYSWSFGSSSEVKERYFAPGVVALNQPVIKYVGSTDAGKQFVITVDNSDQIDSNPQGIYYTLPGAEAVAYTDTLVVANDVYGWLTAVSQLEGCETSAAAYRYLDNRASYNETYVAVTAETAEMPAEAADLEIADIATLNATLAAAFKPTGRIFFHKAVHAGYNTLVLPFGMTTANFESGVVEVTDEAGNVLTRGTDFEVVRLQATTSFLSLEADLAAGENVYTGNLVANTQSYLLKVSDDLVGHELIFVSGENAQNLSINKVDLSSLAAEGKWLLKPNATFAPVASEVPVYLVNEDGSALVLQAAGTKVPPYSFAVIGDSATVASTTTIPLLSGATAIESLNQELKEQGIIFDLQGRRAGALKAGEIYFRDGKKFIQR